MPERFVIVSDLHLGREPKRATADMLRPLWQGANHLIVNGDVAELYDPRFIEMAEQQTLRLQELCEADGVTLTLLAGNHDPDVSEQRYLYLNDGKILITHGDSVHPAIAPWCTTAPLMQNAFDQAMAAVPVETREHLETRLAATRLAAVAKWEHMRQTMIAYGFRRMLRRPWSFLHVLHYWHTFPTEMSKFAERYAPDARVLITGHTHRQGIWKRGERTVINTGGYAFPAKPRIVVIEGPSVSVFRVVRREGLHHPEANPLVRFEI